MSLIRSILILLLALAPAPVVVPGSTLSDDEAAIRKHIEHFLSDPFTDTSETEMDAIAVFANQSKDIEVDISTKVCFWTLSDMDGKAKEILLAAFLAGNVRSQLDTATKQDDSYSGMVQVLRVYRALKQRDPKYKDAGLDKFAGLQAKGELNQHILDLRAEATGKAKGDAPPPKDKKK